MNGDETIAANLLYRHFETLVDDNLRWQMLIDENIVWELAYAAALGHPTRLSGREEVVRHVTWFLGAGQNFRFFDLKVFPFADSEGAVGQVMADGTIKSTGRIYQQEYVVFLRAKGGKIIFMREYFDPTRAAKALNIPILGI